MKKDEQKPSFLKERKAQTRSSSSLGYTHPVRVPFGLRDFAFQCGFSSISKTIIDIVGESFVIKGMLKRLLFSN
jgi:hypothetical protein